MSKWLSLLLLCIAANAFASSADSGRCPWKLPFTISIYSRGSAHQYGDNYPTHGPVQHCDSGFSVATHAFGFFIDTSTNYVPYLSYNTGYNGQQRYNLSADTLRLYCSYEDSTGGLPAKTISLLIAFMPGRDSIISFIYTEDDIVAGIPWSYSSSGIDPGHDGYHRRYVFQVFSLDFDDTSIFTGGSGLAKHKFLMNYFETQIHYSEPSSYQYGTWNYNDFSADSLDLSGIFRPTHFSDQAAVANALPPVKGLTVTASNGSLRCSFGAADNNRILEIFSPLGIKTASCSVAPGQMEATIRNIAAGFYFVRLGSAIEKVYIAD
ncbi:MAG: hypothetical protein Q8922_02285 [Bacteroidota bacterium]|nr:hypothetical protein [Bacteroidota bacterium]MDP4232297.1 hypothetical protein [Bacteroidota bacterium]MDP4241436.1 hypothetical protein [Bacteroidota bacterium]MDP4286740.1 hypothetical protein [Bacteroidota bacterium]